MELGLICRSAIIKMFIVGQCFLYSFRKYLNVNTIYVFSTFLFFHILSFIDMLFSKPKFTSKKKKVTSNIKKNLEVILPPQRKRPLSTIYKCLLLFATFVGALFFAHFILKKYTI